MTHISCNHGILVYIGSNPPGDEEHPLRMFLGDRLPGIFIPIFFAFNQAHGSQEEGKGAILGVYRIRVLWIPAARICLAGGGRITRWQATWGDPYIIISIGP